MSFMYDDPTSRTMNGQNDHEHNLLHEFNKLFEPLQIVNQKLGVQST